MNPQLKGTKVAPHYILDIPAGKTHTIRCRLSVQPDRVPQPFGKSSFDEVLATRRMEADAFYRTVIPGECLVSNTRCILMVSDLQVTR